MDALTDRYLFDLIKRGGADIGKPGMPGFGFHLTDAQIEELVRYVRSLYLLRPPLALERLTESSHGQLLYELPHPRRDGSTHLRLDP